MDIAARISELLFDYECVVLPGLGGFITNDKPAQLNRITHQLKPPFREILFNVQLTANDGLLAKHISETESIPYKAARQKVEEFVTWCRNELQAGRQIGFSQIGTLAFDTNHNIVFEQDHQINYNPDSFGLAPLVSPAIKRVSQEEKIKGIIIPHAGTGRRTDRKAARSSDAKPQKLKKSFYRFPLALMSLLLLVILVTSLFMQKQSSLISFAGLLPFASTEDNVNEKPVKDQNTKQDPELTFTDERESNLVENQDVITEQFQNTAVNLPVEEEIQAGDEEASTENHITSGAKETPVEPIVEATIPPEPTINKNKPAPRPTGKQYYIIAGSFSKEQNAQKLINQLTEKGFDAIVADTNKNGMYRVAYAYYSNRVDAKQRLLAIRQEENADAWLLRK